MGQKIVVGHISKGLRNDVTPFNIDKDAFAMLVNAYQWRGRVKRKRGTALLGRLQRFFNSNSISYNTNTTTITLDGSGNGNIITGFSLQTNATIVPGTVTITAPGPTVYTDPAMNGTLSPSGTINYGTGAIVIAAAAGQAVTVSLSYYPDLPVMGFEDLSLSPTTFGGNIAFDTVYSYNVLRTAPYSIYDVSFYKNPTTATYPSYVSKTNPTPTTWNGKNYQQFWTVNYQGAFWATNGITVPFNTTNIGMQYKFITNVVVVAAGPPAIVTLTIAAHGLVVGDFVFLNEIVGNTGINFQTGYVIALNSVNSVNVELPNATVGGAYSSGGIAQYLTNRSDPTKDCLRWYDGDPTTNGNPPLLNEPNGWVNFAPPLSQFNYSIDDETPFQYYLVGARMIVPFKDRLLFIGPVIQSSAAGSQVYLQDCVIYSQNGTPYYTASFTGDPGLPTTVFHPILVPVDQTATAPAYWEDQTGFGGFTAAGVEEAITTVSSVGDVLIMGFNRTLQTRFVYSGNDLNPFNFFIVNSELPTSSTFSIINMDEGVIARGDRGYIITSQTTAKRIDLDIPDEVFQIKLTDNGTQRVCAARDFISEWIYFTYPVNTGKDSVYVYPNQTLQYNYRDNSWAIFNECYTTYGEWRKRTGLTWATVGDFFPTWEQWNQPWNSGSSTTLQPQVVGGNQQGFLIIRNVGTGESNSLYIRNIVNSIVTSPDHCLNNGDYITISGALGTVGPSVNGQIFSISMATQNTFVLNPPLPTGLTYLGLGLIKRMYVPFIQTMQYPTAWDMGRKTRLGPQMYLLTTTNKAQITLQIFLSQNSDYAYNTGPIVPAANSPNNSLIYSTVLYTCTESCNLGLTPANTNLQMISEINAEGTDAASPQQQIWHRVNTSLIGDTVQIGFTMSDAQMRDPDFINQFAEIEVHGWILDTNPSQLLC